MTTQRERMRMLAYEWHGGQESALYSYASTGAVIHTEGHRANLVGEVQKCVLWCEMTPDTREAADLPGLLELLAAVRAAPLKEAEVGFPEERGGGGMP